VNNAGIYHFQPLEDITEDEFHLQFNTNVLGTILAAKEAANPPYITGMMVSGASPIYAGIYQFIIVAMILATWRSCQST